MTDEDPAELSPEDRAAYLEEWFRWHMENEPEPGPGDEYLRPVVTIDPGPYL